MNNTPSTQSPREFIGRLVRPYGRFLLVFSALILPVVLDSLLDLYLNLGMGGDVPSNTLQRLALVTSEYRGLVFLPAVILHMKVFGGPSSLYTGGYLSVSHAAFIVLTAGVYAIVINKIMKRNRTLGWAIIAFLIVLVPLIFNLIMFLGLRGLAD